MVDSTNPPVAEPVYCGCGDQIMKDDGAMCGTCVMMKRPEARADAGWHERRWRDYERDYILPCFKIADEIGFDLKAAVAEARGNCVMRLIEELRRRAASPLSPEAQGPKLLVASDLKPGGPYNFRNQPDRLIYIRQFNGWHQFKKIGDPRVVWAEVLDEDLHMIEETKP